METFRNIAIAVLVPWFANAHDVSSAYASTDDLEQRLDAAASSSLERCAAHDGANYGWSLRLDDDAFAAHNRADRDYTAGLSVTLYDSSERRPTAAARRALRWLDEATGFAEESLCAGVAHRAEISDFGLVLFSPDEIGRTELAEGERSYANLLYVSSSHYALNAEQSVMRQSTMTIGVLGHPAAEAIHRSVHDLLGSQDPRGYSHQISDGGELTARYSVARRSLLAHGSGRSAYDLSLALEGSVGSSQKV